MTSINRGRRAVGAAAVLVLVIGASGLAAAIAQSSAGGYFTTPAGSFRTTTSVLLTDEIDVGTGLPADPEPDLGELGRIRVHVEAADAATHLFIGIGDRDAVHDYLDGTAHDEFTGATCNPFHASFDHVPGAETVTAPGAQPFWVAQSTGGSDTTLEWDKTAGPWSLIVANADGRPGLDVRADLGLRFGFLAPLGAAPRHRRAPPRRRLRRAAVSTSRRARGGDDLDHRSLALLRQCVGREASRSGKRRTHRRCHGVSTARYS